MFSKFRDATRLWLDIKEPKEPKDWSGEFARLEKEHWKMKQVLTDRTSSNCSVCGRKILLWPMETSAYYVKDGNAYHSDCYSKREENA